MSDNREDSSAVHTLKFRSRVSSGVPYQSFQHIHIGSGVEGDVARDPDLVGLNLNNPDQHRPMIMELLTIFEELPSAPTPVAHSAPMPIKPLCQGIGPCKGHFLQDY
eukprot:1753186-Amphidinium_carterae.1